MKSKQIKGTAAGIIESSLAEVSALLLNINPGKTGGENLPLVLNGMPDIVEIQGGPKKFTVSAGDNSTLVRLCFIDVDQENCGVSIYGGWWFRGEYTIKSHAKGTLLTYNLYNAATGISGMIAGLLHRQELTVARSTLEVMLQKLKERLNCAAYLDE